MPAEDESAPKDPLTLKQRKFVEFYIGEANGNATEAARLSGYTGSEGTLRAIASENLAKPNISAEIARRCKELTIGPEDVLRRLTEHATSTAADFLDLAEGEPTLSLKKAKERGKLHLIKSIKVGTKGEIEVKLHDAQAALVQLGRHYKLFVDRTEVSGDPDAPPVKEIVVYRPLNEADERAA